MARKARLFIPNTAQHIVVRGHNRSPVLARVEDFRYMYKCLLNAAMSNQLTIHAWVFMHNHIHLLATPSTAKSIPQTMQSIGSNYARFFNKHYGRSGALWEGRYKSALVDSDRYLLCCYRYIELNPVRAHIVKKPEDYPYSSYHFNALGKADKLITPHEVFLSLSGSGSEPEAPAPDKNKENRAYIALFDEILSRKELTQIRRATQKNHAIGSNQFMLRVAKLLT